MKTTITLKFLQKPVIGLMMFLLMGSAAYGQIFSLYPVIKPQPVSADFCYNDARTYQKFTAGVTNYTTLQWQYYWSPYVIIGKKSEEITLPIETRVV